MINSEHHVLILGCGRSGTSIFGEYFEHLNAYTYLSEPPFAHLKALDYSKPVAIKVPKESPEFPPTPGLSFPLESMLTTIPEPRIFFWQVRHPLDTICSLKVGISKNWGHHPKPPDWQDWLERPLVEQCAHHWNYINTIGYEKVADLVEISRFEDMIARPFEFASRLNGIIGINTERNLPEIQQWVSRVQNTNNRQFIEAKTSQPYSTKDHTVRVERWKENLTKNEIESVVPIIMETARKFDYELP